MDTTPPPALPAHVTALQHYFETLTLDSVALLPSFYAPQARFKDPFNDVQGVTAIERVFRHMFVQVEAPRFVIHTVFGDATQAFYGWDFRFLAPRLGPGEQSIRGSSHLTFGPDGRVTVHRDYWDAAEELYAKLPVVGGLMRWLQRRASA